MTHRIEVVGELDFPDGTRRVMFRCVHGDCVDGHVEVSPPAAADAIVARVVDGHRDGTLLGGLLEVVPG